MRRWIIYIALFTLVGSAACTKKIVLKNAKYNQPGKFAFSKNMNNDYFVDMEISDSLELRWVNDAHGSFVNSSAIFYDDYMFVSDLSGRLYCFLDSTGKEIGAEKYKGEVSASPLINGSTIIFGVNFYSEKYSTLFFFDFIEGKYRKEINISGSIVNEFVNTDDGFALLTQTGNLIKYDYNGEELWEYESGALTLGSPFMTGGRIYFGTIQGDLVCVDYESGSEMWREAITDRIVSSPVKSGNRIVIGDANGSLICFDETGKSIVWIYDTFGMIKSQPVVVGGNVLVGNLSGEFYSIDLNNGSLNWQLSLGGVFNTTPLAFRNLLIQPDLNRKVYIIDHRTGEVANELNYEGRVRLSPAFYRNKVYIGVDRGDIYVYRVIPL